MRFIRFSIVLFLTLGLWFCKKEKRPEPVESIRNLVVITIDTLRPDALSIYGGKTNTPFFEKFASRAHVFEKAFTTSPITLPAHTSLFTGMTPLTHGVRHNGVFRASRDLPLLAKIAKKNGLQTAAIIGAFPLAAPFGLHQGFDFYDDSFPPPPSTPGTFVYAEKNAEQVRKSAENWLKNHQQNPFFLWLHFFDPHHPYLDHGQAGIPPYQQEVHYVDQQLNILFERYPLDQNALVILTSDHGEAFGEHREVSHSLFVYNTTLWIPLLIKTPNSIAARHRNLVRIIDVFPTILDLMNWERPAGIEGVSLVDRLKGLPEKTSVYHYAETMAPAIDFGWSPLQSIQDLKYKYIAAPRAEFYNLQTDPGETNNLFPSKEATPYIQELERLRKNTRTLSMAYEPSPEEREKLKALGYLSGKSTPGKEDPKDKVEIAVEMARLAVEPLPLTKKIQNYEKLLKKDPDNPLLLMRTAEIFLQQKKYREAENLFQKAVRISPVASAYNGLAAAYFHQADLKKAEAVLTEAEQKGLADGETYYNLAEFAWQRREKEKAFQWYQKSCQLRYKQAYLRMARLYAEMNRYQEAFSKLDEAEKIFSWEAAIDFHRGMIFRSMKNPLQAAASFEKALTRDPNSWEIYYQIGISYHQAGNRQKSIAALQQFLKIAPATAKEERQRAEQILQQQPPEP